MAVVDYSRLRAKIAAGLLAAGAALGVITVAAPHSARTSDTMVLGCCGLVVVLAAVTWRFGRWFRDWTMGTLMLAAAATITIATAVEGLDGTSAQDNVMLYLVPVLYAGCFLPLGWAILTTVASAVSYAWLLAAQAPPATGYARWLTTVFVLVTATAAVRVLRTQLFAALAELARRAARDPLTGLLNRRAFDERINLELARRDRTAEPVAVLMCDLDHFKAVNDRHGHAAGDKVLRRVSAQLVDEVRTIDAVGRLGGEELAVLLPSCDAAQGLIVAERLRATVAAVGHGPRATISIGVSDTSIATTAPELLAAADRALYEAKRAGRNCVRQVATPGDESRQLRSTGQPAS